MIEVLCVGQLAADILVRPVDRLDFVNDTQRVDVIDIRNGGDSLNVAVGLKKLGHQVGFAGKIGDDLQGDFLVNTMDQAGIDRRGLIRAANLSTCTVVVIINSTGERTFFYQKQNVGAADFMHLQCGKSIRKNVELQPSAALLHVRSSYTLPFIQTTFYPGAGFPNKEAIRVFPEGLFTLLSFLQLPIDKIDRPHL